MLKPAPKPVLMTCYGEINVLPNTLEITIQLIKRPSLTPNDAGCQEWISGQMVPLGFNPTHLPFGNVKNLWLRRGVSAPLLVFVGHTDVVPTGPLEEWHSHPFEPEIRNGYLYGRGAADMKGSIASFMVACERFVHQNPHHAGSIALLLTSDEEGPAIEGTTRVVQWLKNQNIEPQYCLVGEPTCVHVLGDTIKNGRRGSLSGVLTVHGIQGHVAYPQLAQNPIHQLAPALAEWVKIKWDEANDDFTETTFQISNLQSGTGAGNVIPGTLKAWFNFRFSTASTVEELKQRVHQLLNRHNLNYQIDWQLSATPFLTPRGSLVDQLSASIRDETQQETTVSTTGGTSDGRFMSQICPQVVELGPCNATIHQINECVSVQELESLSNIYFNLLTRLLVTS